MKLIIAGSSGFVGKAVIQECIANTNITHLFILTRKTLPKELTENAKATVIIHNDFSHYPEELLRQLDGSEGCIWAIGGRVSQFPDLETCQKVGVDYTLAGANAFITSLAPKLPNGKKFRFVFCSGKYTEWDQDKRLSFLADSRKIKGQVEKGLCELADKESNRFEVWCARPSGILPSNTGYFSKLTGKLYDAILIHDLARALVRIALDGYPLRIIESDKLSGIATKDQ